MDCVFIVNTISTGPAQTSGTLMAGMAARGHRVFVARAGSVSLDVDDRIVARAGAQRTPKTWKKGQHEVELGPGVLVVVRTNPARSSRLQIHWSLLQLLTMAKTRGAVVINDPEGLLRASSKLYLHMMPRELRPAGIVSADVGEIRSFIESSPSGAVIKPLLGTRGTDVFRISGTEPNLNQIIEVVTRSGLAVVQEYVEEAAEGDVRVYLLDGEVLTVEGQVAAVRRVPSGGDFRSNVHVGAVPAATRLTPPQLRAAEAVAPRIAADGIALSGLDVIGDKIVEINVFAAGGLKDANAFYGVDFTTPVLEFFERRAANPNESP